MVKPILRYLPVAIVIISGMIYININSNALTPLFSIKSIDILNISCLFFVFFLVTGYTFYLLISFLSVRLTIIEVVGLTFLTNFGNYLGPTRPGAALKAIYLKGQKGLSYANFSAVLAANGFLLFFVSGTTGLLLLAFLWLQTSILPISLIIICMMFIIISILPMMFQFRRIQHQGRICQILNNAITGFELIKSQKYKLLAVCCSVLIQYFIAAWILVIAYHALGQPILLVTALVIGVFTSISNFFTLTPNNIGVQEIVMASLYTMTGMDFTSGLLGASLIRAVHIILTFVLTPIFVYLLLKSSDLSLSAILPGRKK